MRRAASSWRPRTNVIVRVLIYNVRIDLTVPGGTIAVNREPGEDHAHEDMHVAVRDAFDAARRKLQDHMRRLEGKTKQHVAEGSA